MLRMSKVFVTFLPTSTAPNCTVPGSICSWATPLIDEPVTGTVTVPVEDFTTSEVL